MTSDTLDPSVDTLRARARARRRAFARSSDSRFVRTMRTVMDDYLKAREEGVSREDAVKGIEAALRELWAKPPSRFVSACGRCDDTGWRYLACTHGQRCGRRSCSDREEAYAHAMVIPCDCAKGDRFKARLQSLEEEVARVGRTKKRTGFTRIGQ